MTDNETGDVPVTDTDDVSQKESNMGYITVGVAGSFVGHYGIKAVEERFDAIHHGHADAVARAIEYLAEIVLPRATALDHDLHAEGSEPARGFTPERILLKPPDNPKVSRVRA